MGEKHFSSSKISTLISVFAYNFKTFLFHKLVEIHLRMLPFLRHQGLKLITLSRFHHNTISQAVDSKSCHFVSLFRTQYSMMSHFPRLKSCLSRERSFIFSSVLLCCNKIINWTDICPGNVSFGGLQRPFFFIPRKRSCLCCLKYLCEVKVWKWFSSCVVLKILSSEDLAWNKNVTKYNELV